MVIKEDGPRESSARQMKDAAIRLVRLELPTPEYLDTIQAAAFLNATRKQLEHWRTAGGGPPYSKLGRHVRYSVADLRDWMAERRTNSTSQEVA